MDWTSITLSAELALVTLVILLPLAMAAGRWLAVTPFTGKPWIEGLLGLAPSAAAHGHRLLPAGGDGQPDGAR